MPEAFFSAPALYFHALHRYRLLFAIPSLANLSLHAGSRNLRLATRQGFQSAAERSVHNLIMGQLLAKGRANQAMPLLCWIKEGGRRHWRKSRSCCKRLQ